VALKRLPALVLSLVLILVAVTGGCVAEKTVTPPQPAPAPVAQNVTPQEAFTLIQKNRNNPDFTIIDVRTPPEFAEEHIENAVNIDFYSPTFRDELSRLNRNKAYLIYCRSGRRSGDALSIMAELNFREVYNISGGIIAWKAEARPTVK